MSARERLIRWLAGPTWIGDMLNRRATVEQYLWDVANGRREAPTPEEARAWAIKLGVPSGFGRKAP
jgi:hypothetical protein